MTPSEMMMMMLRDRLEFRAKIGVEEIMCVRVGQRIILYTIYVQVIGEIIRTI